MQTVQRFLFGLIALLALTVGWVALLPTPAFACSCALITIGDLDPTQNQVYVATAGQSTPQGTPMAVDVWFSGPGAAPVVILAASSFGDSAGCGTEPFAPGSRWIVTAWASDPSRPPTTGLCQPHGQLDTPEGQVLLAEAEAAYGPGTVPDGGAAPSVGDTETGPLAIVGVVIIGGTIIGLILVAVVVVLRRDRAAG